MPGFFSFHKMVSTSIIKVSYVLGLVLITLWGLVAIGFGIFMMVNTAQAPEVTGRLLYFDQGALSIAVGVLVLIFGNLLWRLICEGWILLFSMHELLASIAGSIGGSEPSHVGYQRKFS